MFKQYFINICVILYLFISCKNSINNKTNIPNFTILTDKNSDISFDRIFSKIECTPINEGKNKLDELGILNVQDSICFLSDNGNMSLLRITPKGELTPFIQRGLPGNNNYNLISDFVIESDGSGISILEPWGNIFKYSTVGKFLHKEQLDIKFAVHYLFNGLKGYYLYSATEPKKVFSYSLAQGLVHIEDGSPFYFRKTTITPIVSPFFIDNNELYYYHPGWNLLYKLKDNISTTLFEINFSPEAFDYSQIEENLSSSQSNLEKYYKNNPLKPFCFNYLLKYNNIILGCYSTGDRTSKYFFKDDNDEMYSFKSFSEGVILPTRCVAKYKNYFYSVVEIGAPENLLNNQYYNEKILGRDQIDKLKNLNFKPYYVLLKYFIRQDKF